MYPNSAEQATEASARPYRLFSWVYVTSATGKFRRRRVNVLKGATPEGLAERFATNVHKFVTDPTIRSISVDVRTPPSPELRMHLEEDDDLAWRHDPETTTQVVGLLKAHFADLNINGSEIYIG